MALVLNLYKYLLVPILVDWLYLKELSHFDSALCNTVLRKLLLSVLHYENGVAFKVINEGSSQIFRWIIIRHINVSSMTFHSSELIKQDEIKEESITNSFRFLSWLFSGLSSKRSHYLTTHQLLTNDMANNLLAHFSMMGEQNKLTFLDLSECYLLSDNILISILTYSAKLHTVNLSNCGHITDASMVTLGSKNKEVQTLTLNGCILLTDVGICAVARGCGQTLLLLDVYDCFRISEHSIAEIASNCIELGHLNFGYNHNYHNQHMMFPRLAFNTKDIALHCPHLTYLNTDRCSDIGIDIISKYGHSLQTLILSRFVFMQLDPTSLAAGCPQLHTFHLTQSNIMLKSSVIATFLLGCHNLTNILLSGTGCIDLMCMKAIAEYVGLVKLNLSECILLNNIDLEKIIITNQHTLKSLIISDCKLLHQISQFNIRVFTLCTHLTELDLHGISMINGDCISEIAKSCLALTTLHCGQLYTDVVVADNDIRTHLLHIHTLGFDYQTTDLSHSNRLYTFCQHYNKQLTSLSLHYATLCNEDMLGIATYCPNLTCLSLQECNFNHVSDVALETMFKACTKLRKLNLSKSNYKVHNLLLIAFNCRVLCYLNLIGSCNVNDSDYKMLKNKCTCLTLLGCGTSAGFT